MSNTQVFVDNMRLYRTDVCFFRIQKNGIVDIYKTKIISVIHEIHIT